MAESIQSSNSNITSSTDNNNATDEKKLSSELKTPSISRIGRPCMLHSQVPKAATPHSDQKNGSICVELYLEATGRRRSSDHGVILTSDTDSFVIGQRVWVGGIKPGQIAYIGETHFAPGDWAGIVLDEPNGKNDGCVAGKRYFQCEPKKGIFSRLTRLTHEPLVTSLAFMKEYSPGFTTRSIISPERRSVSPTFSTRSSLLRSPGKHGLTVGDRVIVSSGFGSRPGILKYIGETKFAQGNWCGVQLDEPSGKNDGSIEGVKYFECPPKYGIFVPIAKVTLSPTVKNTRLSRAGSRESLASVGTLNSIATTNSSRLRMSAQKLKMTSAKPVTTNINQKPNYSLQDVIREKQNHIEQLMIERELDREDAQNQALTFQKTISELKTQISDLESRLNEEKKKTDELQNSVDEAQFCGDELSAQTHVYKEKIAELERRVESLNLIAAAGDGGGTGNQEASAAKLEEKYKEIIDKCSHLKEENNTFTNRIQQLEKEIKLKNENLEELHHRFNNIQTENLKLAESTEKNQKDLIHDYEQKLKTLQDENNKLKIENTKKMSSSETQLFELNELKEKYECLLQENQELKSQKEFELNEAILKVQDLEARIQAKEIEYKINVEKFTTQIKSLEDEKQTLGKSVHEKEIMFMNLKPKEMDLNDIFMKLKLLTNQCSPQKVDIIRDYYKKRLESLETHKIKRRQIIENRNSSINLLQSRQIELREKFSKFYNNLKKLFDENESNVMLPDFSENESDLNQCLQQIENIKSELKTKIQEYQIEIEHYKENLSSSQKENENLAMLLKKAEARLIALQENSSAVTEEIQKKSNEYEKMATTLFTREKECEELKSNLNNSLEKCKSLENDCKKIQEYQTEIENYKETLNSSQKENENLAMLLKKAEARLSALQENTSAVSEEIQKKSNEYEKMATTLFTKEKECEELKRNLENSIEKCKSIENDSKNEITRLIQLLTEKDKSSVESENVNLTKIKSLEDKLKEQGAGKIALENKFNELEGRTNEFEKLASFLPGKEKECEELRNEVETISSKYKSLENDSKAEIAKLTEILQLKELTSTELENSNLIKIQTLEKQLQEQISVQTQLENKYKEIEINNIKLSTIINDLNAQINKFQEDSSNFGKNFQTKQDEFAKEKENLILENKKLLLTIETNKMDEQSRMATMEDQQKQQTELLLNEIKVKLFEKDEEIANLKANLEAMKSKDQTAMQEFFVNYNKIKEQLETEISVNTKNIKEIESLKMLLEQKEEEQVDLVVEVHDLKNHIAAIEKEQEIKQENPTVIQQQNGAKLEVANKLNNENVKLSNNGANEVVSTTTSDLSLLNDNDAMSQINFLNSIIADMQKKNESLKEKIDTLESLSSSDKIFSNLSEILVKRKPAPRVFCDICDQFDLHETEDCHLQDSENFNEQQQQQPLSDSKDGKKKKEKPPPRKYCESCEVFGHATGECADDETY